MPLTAPWPFRPAPADRRRSYRRDEPVFAPRPALPIRPDVRFATWRDAPRIAWWSCIGVLHRRAWLLRIPILVMSPLALAIEVARIAAWVASRREFIVMYAPEGAPIACLGILRTTRDWKLVDHASASPGTGDGARLRSAISGNLASQADVRCIRIRARAFNQKLAEAYMADLPGLHVAPSRWRRRRNVEGGQRIRHGQRLVRHPR